MSIKVTNWVWARSESRNGARLVLLALADRADENGCAWPSVADLAERTKLTERAVRKGIASLVELGELKVENGGGRHRVNRYWIIPKPGTMDRVTDEKPGTLDRVSRRETLNFEPETLNFATQNTELCDRNPVQSSAEPSVEPPTEPSGNQPPTRASGHSAADRMLDKWWEQYGRTTAQGRHTIRRAVSDALTNGVEPSELWQALTRLGDLSKPVTGGTLQFALADVRKASAGGEVVPLRDRQQQSTDDIFTRAMRRAEEADRQKGAS